MVSKKNFIRRGFGYLIDLFILGVVFTLIAVALNSALGTNIIAPSLVNYSRCAETQILPPERMQKLLPLSGFQTHQQILCEVTTMMVTTYHQVTLERIEVADGITKRNAIRFPVDENGNPTIVIAIGDYMFLFAPLIFAWLLSRSGQTPGKRFMGIKVVQTGHQPPRFGAAVKREYLKSIILVVTGALSIIVSIYVYSQTLEQLAALVDAVEVFGVWFWAFMFGSLIFAIATFWYTFGSFIKWRGRTYWDRWTNLDTGKSAELAEATL